MDEALALRVRKAREDFPRGSTWRHYRNARVYRVLRIVVFKKGDRDTLLVEYTEQGITEDEVPYARTPEDFRAAFSQIPTGSER